ncbi:hypothetical protein BN938_0905 [Mucinivorans hirudinis]|uniref:Uncharacterized protein n=1 Tax=Mucinivorans hirudinis TaxID=1433126 RepID=A0A060R766_9BACT|nr:hypothetical protein BN938_0905 [Mucinivorans hirudinis]
MVGFHRVPDTCQEVCNWVCHFCKMKNYNLLPFNAIHTINISIGYKICTQRTAKLHIYISKSNFYSFFIQYCVMFYEFLTPSTLLRHPT